MLHAELRHRQQKHSLLALSLLFNQDLRITTAFPLSLLAMIGWSNYNLSLRVMKHFQMKSVAVYVVCVLM